MAVGGGGSGDLRPSESSRRTSDDGNNGRAGNITPGGKQIVRAQTRHIGNVGGQVREVIHFCYWNCGSTSFRERKSIVAAMCAIKTPDESRKSIVAAIP